MTSIIYICLYFYIKSQYKNHAANMEDAKILQLILDKSLIGYWDWNLKEDRGIVSKSFQQMFGNDPDFTTSSVMEFIQSKLLPEDFEKSKTALRLHFSSRGAIPYNVEERYLHINGSIVWSNTRGEVIEWDENDNPIRMIGLHIDITKQKEQEDLLIKNNNILNSIINNIPQSIFWKDQNSVYLGCNDTYAKLIGINAPNSITGKTDFDIFDNKIDVETYVHDDQLVLSDNLPKLNMVEKFTDASGKPLLVNTSKVPIPDLNGNPYAVLGITNDITEQELLKKELIQTNKLYNTLSQINKLTINVSSKEELFNHVCRLITEVGEFKIAMIGEPSGIFLKPIAFSGIDIEYAQKVKVTIDDSPEGNGPAGMAYKQGKYFVVNDFLSNISTAPWKKEAMVLDLRSIATFPLKCYDKVVAALGVYSNQINYFQTKEIDLLEEIAYAIGYGLEKLANQAKQKEWNEEIIKAKEEWELTFDSIPDLIAILDTNYNILRTNKAMRAHLNMPECNSTVQKCYNVMHGSDCAAEDCPYSLLLKDKESHSTTRFEKQLNGYYTIATSPIFNKDGSLRGSVHISRNITEQKLAENKIRQFAEIIENSNAFIGIANMDGNLTYLNKSNRKVFDIENDFDLTKLKITDFLTEKALDTYFNHTIPETSKHGIWSGELEWKNKSGRTIPVILVTMLHRDAEGNPEFTSATAIDISEIKKNEINLAKSAEELHSLTEHLQIIRDEERRHIAKEIHDELGQNLTSVTMDVAWISTHLDDDRNILATRIEQLKKTATETVQTSRRIYNSLYPQMLDEIGLMATIKWHANNYLKPHHIDFDILSNMQEDDVFPDYHNLLLNIYRIYQESATNILRYSKATFVTIELTYYKDLIELKVNDNGIGFDIDKVDFTQHHGLIGIRERVRTLDGTLSIKSSLGKGTFTTVCIPVSKNLK